MSLLFDARPLREFPAFRRLWAGSALSSIGSQMTNLAVIAQVYDLTHSSVAVAGLGLILAISMVSLGLFGGSVADAVDRRKLVLITTTGFAIVAALFAVQAFFDFRQLWLLYLLAGVQSVLIAAGAPARRTFLSRLLPPERVSAGVALEQLSFHASMSAGPALAGILIGIGGPQLCYVVDFVSFLGAFYGLTGLDPMPPREGVARPGVAAVVEGLRFIRRTPVLAGAFLADLSATTLGMPIALFPAINAEKFGGAPQTLGVLMASLAIGGFIGSAFSGPAHRIRKQGRAMLWTVAVWGAGIAGFALADTLWLGVLLLATAGAADTISVIFRATAVQLETPDHLRGRVTAVDFVIGAGGPEIGNVRAGAVAAFTTASVSALTGGLATVLGVLVIRLTLPALSRYEAKLEER
ncbi:Predicted arabinose efflux permease, MFS family [Amycolatopsis xylanica]|uniref:Predicted arabinose efflux permease, MFS family n=1 Tax=Amycolatopsis xylanica TaxID=589385 RepID=A0A1H2UF04_9PSEU|nr:MFS transporter [Amycolatopsis xylanica]SDW54700.1 Predicted arabinose efflux permease, MFS family [Amycolatopsis xylanica]